VNGGDERKNRRRRRRRIGHHGQQRVVKPARPGASAVPRRAATSAPTFALEPSGFNSLETRRFGQETPSPWGSEESGPGGWAYGCRCVTLNADRRPARRLASGWAVFYRRQMGGRHVSRGPVADLLECLIQIKGLAETPRRLEQRTASAASTGAIRLSAAARVARRMAEAETCFGRCLALMLAEVEPVLPVLPRVAGISGNVAGLDGASMPAGREADAGRHWRDQFSARRAATLAVLDRCSAAQLNRIGLEASRRPLTVADLVAVMLAHDTDSLGEV
jgi:hypothetical protein